MCWVWARPSSNVIDSSAPHTQYRVKWVGFELDPVEWTNQADVEGCVALDEWAACKKMVVVVDKRKETHRYFVPMVDRGKPQAGRDGKGGKENHDAVGVGGDGVPAEADSEF